MSYEVLESKLTYEGKIVKVTVDKLQMPDGKAAYRETVIRGKNAAAALAVDAEGKIIFVRQYRHTFKEMVLEIPAGVMEFICELYPTVGYCTEKIFLYFASDLTPCPCCFDEDEFIEVERYTPEEALEMIYKGEIKDAKTVAAIFAYMTRHK